MEQQKRMVSKCPENEELAAYMLRKWQEMAEQKPKGISENIEMTLSKAYSNVCNSKNPIKTLKEFSHIKGVGKWILRLMQGFFETGSSSSEPEDLTKKGKRNKGSRRYLPQKNSVAYALLITLYRGTENGNEFMRKQELIDAAEASGLSRVPIMPEKGKGKAGRFGSSARESYSGWSCMKTLVTKGLVIKSSCPAKYMLSQEGQEAARECLMRSGMENPIEKTANAKVLSVLDVDNISSQELAHPDSSPEMILLSTNVSRKKKSFDIPRLYIEKSHHVPKSRSDGFKASSNVFSLPPLSFGERFEDAYEVILILDDREQFATRGSRPGRIIENVRTQFKIKIEVIFGREP